MITGKNSGSAVVYGDNKGIEAFGRLMQQRQLERDNEQKQLAAHLANLKTDGLRDYDKDLYYKGFDAWRTKTQDAYAARDKREKFNLQAEADKLYDSLNDLVYKSKQSATQDHALALDMIKDPDKYSDEFKDAYHRSVKAPLYSSDRVEDYTLLPMERDLSKVPDVFNKVNNQLLKEAKEGNPKQMPFKGGNRTGTILQYDTTVQPAQQALAYAELFDLDKSVSYAAKKANPELPWGQNPTAAKAQWVQQMVEQNPLTKTRSTAPVLDTPEAKMTPWQKWMIANGYPWSQGKESANPQLQARVALIEDMANGVKGSGEKLGAFIEGNPNFSKSSKFNIQPTKASGNRKAYVFDVPAKVRYDAEGQEVIVTPRQKYTVDFNDPNYQTRMNEVINNVSDQRMDIGGSVGLKGNSKGTTVKVSPSKTSGKSVPLSKVKSLVGQKGYEGYTEKELIDYYKSQGYKIE